MEILKLSYSAQDEIFGWLTNISSAYFRRSLRRPHHRLQSRRQRWQAMARWLTFWLTVGVIYCILKEANPSMS